VDISKRQGKGGGEEPTFSEVKGVGTSRKIPWTVPWPDMELRTGSGEHSFTGGDRKRNRMLDSTSHVLGESGSSNIKSRKRKRKKKKKEHGGKKGN